MEHLFMLGGLAIYAIGWILLRYGVDLTARGLHWIKWCKVIGITPLFLLTLLFSILTVTRIAFGERFWFNQALVLVATILIEILIWKRPLEGGLGVILAVFTLMLIIPINWRLSLITGVAFYSGIFLLAAGFFSKRLAWVKA